MMVPVGVRGLSDALGPARGGRLVERDADVAQGYAAAVALLVLPAATGVPLFNHHRCYHQSYNECLYLYH